MHSQSCATITTLSFRPSSSPWKETLYPPSFPQSPSPKQALMKDTVICCIKADDFMVCLLDCYTRESRHGELFCYLFFFKKKKPLTYDHLPRKMKSIAKTFRWWFTVQIAAGRICKNCIPLAFARKPPGSCRATRLCCFVTIAVPTTWEMFSESHCVPGDREMGATPAALFLLRQGSVPSVNATQYSLMY
jgi:hypothetical protein